MAEQQNASAPLVVHVVRQLRMGGMENGLINLLNAMPRGRYRHAVACLTDYSDFRKRLTAPDVSVIALHLQSGNDPRALFKIWRLFRTLRPTIVHTRNLAGLDALPMAWLAGVPALVHGEHGWDVFDLHGRSRKYRLYRRFCSLFTDRFVAVSRDIERWLVEMRIPKSRVVQIYNGVDVQRFAPRPAGTAGAVDAQVVTFGTVGRLQPVKDQLTLARAFVHVVHALRGTPLRARLVMVGDGPLLAEIREIVTTAGIADHVWLAGAREDVPEMMSSFDVFVLPSLREGISNTVLEAMACGLPVIATAVGGNPELVVDGETGLLVPPQDPQALANAMLQLVREETLRRRHGKAGRARAEQRFALASMVENYVSLYDTLLSRNAGLATAVN